MKLGKFKFKFRFFSRVKLPTGDKLYAFHFYFFNVFICRTRKMVVNAQPTQTDKG